MGEAADGRNELCAGCSANALLSEGYLLEYLIVSERIPAIIITTGKKKTNETETENETRLWPSAAPDGGL